MPARNLNAADLRPRTAILERPSAARRSALSNSIPTSNLKPRTTPATKPGPTPAAIPQAAQNPPTTPSQSNLQPQTSNHHSGKCSICNHPDRAEIEAAFLNWQPAERIVADFNLPARSTIYRHAKAADLLNQRRNNFRAALDQIIEQAGRVPATASSIISAIELSYRLSGADIAPLKRYETTHIYVHEPNPSLLPRRGWSSDPNPASGLQALKTSRNNRDTKILLQSLTH